MHASLRGQEASADRAASPQWRRAFIITSVVAGILILARSAVFWLYDQAFFDADQAIVGLMAKHLVEGRARPLFYYGQTYMLAVDAWVMAPVVSLLGPTVRSLHGAIVLMNLGAAGLIAYALTRHARLSALSASAALAFFSFAPPLTSSSLIEAGANIGPFLYVPLLWLLRNRPLWFGAVLGVGMLNREFTIYAVPVLLFGDLIDRTWLTRGRLKFWLVAAVSTIAVWQGIQALKPYSDMMGPGTRGQLIGGDAGSQVGNVGDRVAVVPSEFPARIRAMAVDHLPHLWGTRHLPDALAPQGHDWLFWPISALMVLSIGRVLWLEWHGRRPSEPATFAWYLAGVGAVAIAAYVATRPADGMVRRYLLLTLFAPIGITALHLHYEPRRWLRALAVAVVLLWVGGSAADHWAQVRRYAGGREPDETGDLARGLVDRGIFVAEADYWMAYKLSYLTQERIVVASTGIVRIAEYQDKARRAGGALVRISDQPCANGERISLWYVCHEGP